MADRTITALFRSKDAAEQARTQLKTAGIDQVEVHGAEAHGVEEAALKAGEKTRNLFEKIADLFGGHEDTHAYQEGVRRGNYLLTVKADGARADEVVRLLEATEAVDVDEEQKSWREGGWSGRSEPDAAYTNAQDPGVDTRGTAGVQEARAGTSSSGVYGAGATAGALSSRTDYDSSASLQADSAETDRAQAQDATWNSTVSGADQAGASDGAGAYAASELPGITAGADQERGISGTMGATPPPSHEADRAAALRASYGSELPQAGALSANATAGAQAQPGATSTAATTPTDAPGSVSAPGGGVSAESDPALERVTNGADQSLSGGAGRSGRREEGRGNARIRSYVVEGSAEEPGDYQLGGGSVGTETASEGALGSDLRVREATDRAEDLRSGPTGTPSLTTPR